MWPLECDAFAIVLNLLVDAATQEINPLGGFGTSVEKNAIRSTQFIRLAQIACDVQVRFMGNTTITNLASFKTRAVYGKWANTVDALMVNLRTNNSAGLSHENALNGSHHAR